MKFDEINKLEEQKRRAQQGRSQKKKTPKAGIGNLPGKKKEEIEVMVMEMIDGRQHPDSIKFKKEKMFRDNRGNIEFKAKGGRAGYKMGSKCKLATKGKGRAYGKNS